MSEEKKRDWHVKRRVVATFVSVLVSYAIYFFFILPLSGPAYSETGKTVLGGATFLVIEAALFVAVAIPRRSTRVRETTEAESDKIDEEVERIRRRLNPQPKEEGKEKEAAPQQLASSPTTAENIGRHRVAIHRTDYVLADVFLKDAKPLGSKVEGYEIEG